ncbi:MAG: diacylglycerol kinase family protein [Acidobacteriaceae bacterium]
MKSILLLVNPILLRARAKRRAIARVTHVFRKSGAVLDILETGENRAAGAKAKHAVTQGYDAVVVCGGDGTIFDVIQGLAGSPLPLGIIPFGTGNVMAQNLGIPRDAEQAAHCILNGHACRVPLGKITCCVPGGRQSWFFAMAAGMGMHAALMSEARRSGKDVTGKAAYFVAGAKLLLRYPVQSFDVAITTTSGAVIQERVCEALAVRVAGLNRWRPGGDLSFPFLRLATVQGTSRGRLALASWDGLFRGGGARDREQAPDAPAMYRDVTCVVCSPIPERAYDPVLAVQADGEVLGASCAKIEMAGLDIHLLAAEAGRRSLVNQIERN